MNNTSLPTIENLTIEVAFSTAWKVTANEGYVFYLLDNFPEGTPPENIAYSRVAYIPQSVGVEYLETNIIIVPEADVPVNQIYGNTTVPAETV